MKFPLTRAWIAANERGDLKAKVCIADWAQHLADARPVSSWVGWLVENWSRKYVG